MFPDITELIDKFNYIKLNSSVNTKQVTEDNLRFLDLEIQLAQAVFLAEISATLQMLATSGSVSTAIRNREMFNMDLPGHSMVLPC